MTLTLHHRPKRRVRRVSPKHAFYEKLRAFRETWEANGGTRGTLRKARKTQHTLFPKQT